MPTVLTLSDLPGLCFGFYPPLPTGLYTQMLHHANTLNGHSHSSSCFLTCIFARLMIYDTFASLFAVLAHSGMPPAPLRPRSPPFCHPAGQHSRSPLLLFGRPLQSSPTVNSHSRPLHASPLPQSPSFFFTPLLSVHCPPLITHSNFWAGCLVLLFFCLLPFRTRASRTRSAFFTFDVVIFSVLFGTSCIPNHILRGRFFPYWDTRSSCGGICSSIAFSVTSGALPPDCLRSILLSPFLLGSYCRPAPLGPAALNRVCIHSLHCPVSRPSCPLVAPHCIKRTTSLCMPTLRSS